MKCSYCGGTETVKDNPRCWGCGAYKTVTKVKNNSLRDNTSRTNCIHEHGFRTHKDIYGCMVFTCPECGETKTYGKHDAIPTMGM